MPVVGGRARVPSRRLRLVVISALPRTRHTLLLRMLGAGRTFRDALDELQRLPADAGEVSSQIWGTDQVLQGGGYSLQVLGVPIVEP
ncbi:MAG: hypothetical protein MUF54_00585 [Polyangiaceae bacterium]|nr:hypothetical protein [Polyangiaceae bacterium]